MKKDGERGDSRSPFISLYNLKNRTNEILKYRNCVFGTTFL